MAAAVSWAEHRAEQSRAPQEAARAEIASTSKHAWRGSVGKSECPGCSVHDCTAAAVGAPAGSAAAASPHSAASSVKRTQALPSTSQGEPGAQNSSQAMGWPACSKPEKPRLVSLLG